MRTFRQLVCGLQGHDELLKYGNQRMWLVCHSCGYESPGWDFTPGPDRVVRNVVEEEAGPRHALTAAVLLLLAATPSFAQTTRCVIVEKVVRCVLFGVPNSAGNLAALRNAALESNVTLIRFGVSAETPRSGSTSSRGPTLGPWDFPPERPARRLDGTLLTDPVVTYGATPVALIVR